MSSSDRDRWDRRYSEKASGRHGAPTPGMAWLAAATRSAPGGIALDLACGRGRNVGALAALGYRVVAADVSRMALLALGGVNPILRIQLDVDAWTFADAAFDVVVQVDFLDRRALPLARRSVKPGGLYLLDTFAGAAEPGEPGPRSSDHRLGYGELGEVFADWEVLRLEEHLPPGGRATVLAQRPSRVAPLR